MNDNIMKLLPKFLTELGLDEEPMGIFYTDEKPIEGFSPKPNELPTQEKEMKNQKQIFVDLLQQTKSLEKVLCLKNQISKMLKFFTHLPVAC